MELYFRDRHEHLIGEICLYGQFTFRRYFFLNNVLTRCGHTWDRNWFPLYWSIPQTGPQLSTSKDVPCILFLRYEIFLSSGTHWLKLLCAGNNMNYSDRKITSARYILSVGVAVSQSIFFIVPSAGDYSFKGNFDLSFDHWLKSLEIHKCCWGEQFQSFSSRNLQ